MWHRHGEVECSGVWHRQSSVVFGYVKHRRGMVPLSKVKLSIGKVSSCSAQAMSSIVKHKHSIVLFDDVLHRQWRV